MKPFTKRLALVMGLLFTALLCLGIVYIDTTQNYWYVNGGFVKLIVSNQTAQAVITVDTNSLSLGVNTNNANSRSVIILGRPRADAVTGNGISASILGSFLAEGGRGGRALTNGLSASGGTGGQVILVGGVGGEAINTTSNSIAGVGGAISITGGQGAANASGTPGTSIVATNSVTAGNGGGATVSSGEGGASGGAITTATQVLAGASGALTINTPNGASPASGVILRGGAGGAMTITTGNGGNSINTNGANGGAITITAGNAGGGVNAPGAGGIPGAIAITAGSAGAVTGAGNTQPGANFNLSAGNGSTGTTNSDGGHVFITGGVQGSGAVPGNVVVGRTSAGTSRGGLQVGPIVTGTTATLTNLLTITATLDFPSIAAGLVADLPVAFAGAADGDVVTVAVPLASVTNCLWMAFASNAVVYVRAANSQLVTAQDPNSGLFRVKVEKFR